jgi:hypothetical protein
MMMLVCTSKEFWESSFEERRKLVVRQVELFPEAHQQALVGTDTRFGCGFAGCIAGWAMHLAGIFNDPGRDSAVSELAQLLGLDIEMSDAIFSEIYETTAIDLLLNAPVVKSEDRGLPTA